MDAPRIVSPADAFALFGELAGRGAEHVWAACLDERGTVLSMRRGGRDRPHAATLPVAELLREALGC